MSTKFAQRNTEGIKRGGYETTMAVGLRLDEIIHRIGKKITNADTSRIT
jgi:hypothetical protein